MNGTQQLRDYQAPSKEARSQAAAWIARLHDERHGPDLEAEFHRWLGESDEHRRAFNRMTYLWDRAGDIRLRARDDTRFDKTERRGRRLTSWAAPLAAAVVLAAIASFIYRPDRALVTGIGQQQVQELPDGTRVVLNTDTRIEVHYSENARQVRLIRGEALFEVSKRPNWPFLVSAGDQEVRALGTSFIVRHDNIEDLSVTLVEGRISVAPIAQDDGSPPQVPQILAPGQRLIISRHHAPAVDRPELTRVTAWERGRVEFEDTPLADAANEMNRYSNTHIEVLDVQAAHLRIGGVFRAGDSEEFVKIVTAAFGLRADRNGSAIVLSPSEAQPP